jgi:hypothetical protein
VDILRMSPKSCGRGTSSEAALIVGFHLLLPDVASSIFEGALCGWRKVNGSRVERRRDSFSLRRDREPIEGIANADIGVNHLFEFGGSLAVMVGIQMPLAAGVVRMGRTGQWDVDAWWRTRGANERMAAGVLQHGCS